MYRYRLTLLAVLLCPSCGEGGGLITPDRPMLPALALASVSPDLGPNTGGTRATLRGEGFVDGMSVRFGGAAAPGVMLNAPTEVSVVIPAQTGAFGPVPVRLEAPDGRAVERSDLFSYFSQTVQFSRAYETIQSAALNSVHVSDLNGDRKADVALTSQMGSSYELQVLYAQQAGVLSGPSMVATVEPGRLAVADMNGDGKDDLVVTDNAVYLRHGASFRTGASLKGFSGGSLAAADLNGDGRRDLAALASFTTFSALDVLLAEGADQFGNPSLSVVSTECHDSVAGDLNGDRAPELVTRCTDGLTRAFLNDGKGKFSEQNVKTSPGGFGGGVAIRFQLGDMDGDGRLDLIGGVGPSLYLYRGNGDGTFQSEQELFSAKTVPNGLTFLAIGDLNGDRQLDLAVAADKNVVVLLGKGAGVLEAPTPSIGPGTVVRIGDVDGDRRPDLILADVLGVAPLGVYLSK